MCKASFRADVWIGMDGQGDILEGLRQSDDHAVPRPQPHSVLFLEDPMISNSTNSTLFQNSLSFPPSTPRVILTELYLSSRGFFLRLGHVCLPHMLLPQMTHIHLSWWPDMSSSEWALVSVLPQAQHVEYGKYPINICEDVNDSFPWPQYKGYSKSLWIIYVMKITY